jgi:hypothetical protein
MWSIGKSKLIVELLLGFVLENRTAVQKTGN